MWSIAVYVTSWRIDSHILSRACCHPASSHPAEDITNRVGALTDSLGVTTQQSRRLKIELHMQKYANISLSDEILEWKTRHAEEIELTKVADGKARAAHAAKVIVEGELATSLALHTTHDAIVSKLTGQRTSLQAQVSALMLKLDANDVPKAKAEFEIVMRGMDAEFQEKHQMVHTAKKELHDKKSYVEGEVYERRGWSVVALCMLSRVHTSAAYACFSIPLPSHADSHRSHSLHCTIFHAHPIFLLLLLLLLLFVDVSPCSRRRIRRCNRVSPMRISCSIGCATISFASRTCARCRINT
jgi:hypothetical protein